MILYRHLTKRATPACDDKKPKDTKELTFPKGFEHLELPWKKKEDTTVYTSEKATEGMLKLYALKVPGLKGKTINNVLKYLEDNKCLSFAYGGSIRDQFLDAVPNDLDMETTCKVDVLEELCVKAYGKDNCHRGNQMHIGDLKQNDGNTDELDAGYWEETFFGDRTKLEYTTNAITFLGSGSNIVIDITGFGVGDTCNKLIRIPVKKALFGKWLEDNVIFRFWKLRIKGYKVAEGDTWPYIDEQVRRMVKENVFHKYYCKNVHFGRWNKDACNIKDCAKSLKKKYDEVFKQDLKDYWDKEMQPKIDKMECQSCKDAVGC